MQYKCSVEGCEREAEIKKHILCRTHYMRYRNNGDPGIGTIITKRVIKAYKKPELKMLPENK